MKYQWLIPCSTLTLVTPFITSCSTKQVNGNELYQVKSFDYKQDINWSKVDKATINIYKWVEGPVYDAYAQVAYVRNQELIVKLVCDESNPSATHNVEWYGNTWQDSCLEAYFQFLPDQEYINLETNSVNCKCQEFGYKPPPGDWNRQKLWEVSLANSFTTKTTISNDNWEVLIDLPLNKICYWYNQHGLRLLPSDFKPGFEFYGNFYKTQGLGNVHYGMWHEIMTDNPSFHEPTQFGKLKIV